MGALMLILTVIDYLAPIWLTKIGGGSKHAMRGATIGLLVGMLYAPIGLIVGPFLGALIGELLTKSPFLKSLKVAALSFLAFILTTGLKFFYGIGVICILVAALL